jgi:hypothetical protein
MHRHFARVAAVAATGFLTGLVVVAAPAHAATVTCAPDPFEVDDLGTGVTASIAVGGTASRALCQTRTILPGKPLVVDVDYFAFTAVEGQAYTVTADSVGADLVNSSADRGGLSVGFSKVNADGSVSAIPETQTGLNGDRSTSSALPAGRYLIGVADSDQQVYPEDNTLATKTIQGQGGVYTIKLVPSAPPPVLRSIKVSPNPVKAGDRATATLTFTAPILSGGASVPVSSSTPSAAAPGGNQNAPAGVTTWTVPIDARRVGQDTTVTISAHVNEAGPTLTAPLTVRK